MIFLYLIISSRTSAQDSIVSLANHILSLQPPFDRLPAPDHTSYPDAIAKVNAILATALRFASPEQVPVLSEFLFFFFVDCIEVCAGPATGDAVSPVASFPTLSRPACPSLRR